MIGDAIVSFLRGMSIDTKFIKRQGKRVGTYYLEAGSGPRPSNVIYDRSHSSISEAKPDEFDFTKIFADACWFHITGITPALSETGADLSLAAMKEAKNQGIMVSCDLNYRKKLWKYGKDAPGIMNQLMPYVDVVIANEEDIQKSLGMELDQKIGGVSLSRDKYANLAKQLLDEYDNVSTVSITLRESFSANHNDWSAMCYSRKDGQARFSKKYKLKNIVDRVGGGDSFAGGFIYALYKGIEIQEALEFAVAASALKHTIQGDCNRVSVEEVNHLAKGDASGRVNR